MPPHSTVQIVIKSVQYNQGECQIPIITVQIKERNDQNKCPRNQPSKKLLETVQYNTKKSHFSSERPELTNTKSEE